MDKPSKKIRVLHIIGSMRLGGAQVCVKNIIEGNTNPNIEHFLYPLRPKNPVFEVECKQFIYNYPNYDPRKFLAILKICRENKIDIIHTHLSKPSIMAMVLKPFLNCKIIMHDHGNATHPGIQAKFYRLLQRILKKKVDLFISVSKSNYHGIVNNLKVKDSKICLLHNCIDDSIFDISKYSPKENKESKTLCFCGRLDKIKNPITVLKTLLILNKENRDFKVLFLGDGPLKKELIKFGIQNNLDNNFQILGFVEDVARFMKISDYAMMPSQDEGLPLVALEFMRMKVPILCSGAGGLSELIKHNETGIIIKDNSPEEYANTIMKLEVHPELKDKLIDNALEFSDNFTRDKYVNKINNVYYKLIS